MEDSPAGQAGILEGDVIESINGEKVTAFTSLQEAVQAAGKADEAIWLVIDRDGKEITVKVKPTKLEGTEGGLNFLMAPQAGSIVSGDDIAGMKSGVFTFGVPLPNMNPEAGAAGIAAMLPGVAVNGELKSEIEALRNEVSELKGMIKKLLKKVAEEHDEDEDDDSDEKGDK
jgi:membrane-associated protease RseP (regulator of RpoE activity)